MADHETPARIELPLRGAPRRDREGGGTVQPLPAIYAVCWLALVLWDVAILREVRDLKSGDEAGRQCAGHDDPQLPVSEPVRLDAPADASRNGDKFKDVVAASVNDHDVPPALLEGPKDSHRGDRTPK